LTLIRSALRGLLQIADAELAGQLWAVLVSGDDYASTGKPQIDWDDRQAREQLIDGRARDAYACLALLDGRKLTESVEQAAQLLASVVGQDLEQTQDGVFRIARKVAKDRIISTVDQDARHGHQTSARGFHGYKGHVVVDPDSEIVTDTTVTAGNVGDAAMAEDLIDDLLDQPDADGDADETADEHTEPLSEPAGTQPAAHQVPARRSTARRVRRRGPDRPAAPTRRRRRPGPARAGTIRAGVDPKAVRAWAEANGVKVNAPGRLVAAVQDQYRTAVGSRSARPNLGCSKSPARVPLGRFAPTAGLVDELGTDSAQDRGVPV